MRLLTRLARLERRLGSVVPHCPVCARRPVMSENPADGEPCPRCGREPTGFVLICRTVVRTREDVAEALARIRATGGNLLCAGEIPEEAAAGELIRRVRIEADDAGEEAT